MAREAANLARKQYGELHPSVVSSLNNLALVARDRGRDEEAERLFRETLDLDRRLYGPEHPDVKRTRAGVDEFNNRIAESLAGLRKGLKADFEVARQKYEELDKVLDEAKQQDIQDEGEKMLPFQKASLELAKTYDQAADN